MTTGWLGRFVGIGGEGKAMPSTPPQAPADGEGLKELQKKKKKKPDPTIDDDINRLRGSQRRLKQKVDEVNE